MFEHNEREFQDELELESQDFEKILATLRSMREFENASVKHLYSYLSKLLKLKGLEREIPRIVILGQQTIGKTTVIDYLINHPLGYSTNNTGTCCPIVFHISPSNEGSSESFLPLELTSKTLVGSGILHEEITECLIGGEKVSFETLPKKNSERMKKMRMQISPEELRIDIKSRGAMEMIIVDLPGLKEDTNQGSKMTQKIVQEYRSIDDPTNWSWRQKLFLFEELRLRKEQTIVVGTRALEFLQQEVEEISNGDELLERIKKRELSSTYGFGAPLPLYMLELFSLSKEERAIQKMSCRKNAMDRRITAGEKNIKEIINQICDQDHEKEVKEKLLSYFSRDLFEMDLSSKFGQILLKELNSLEKFLKNREDIILIIRKFAEIVYEMVTGNFNILHFSGGHFLDNFGGNLWMNLNDGKETLYNENIPNRNQKNSSAKQKYTIDTFKLEPPSEGIFLRQKISPYLIGKCISLNLVSDSFKESSPDLIKVEFQYKKKDGLFTGDHIKYLSKSQLVPVKKVQVSKVEQNNYYWLLGFKEERWKKLIPVQVLSKTGNKIFFKQIDYIKTIENNVNENEDKNNKENTRLQENSGLPRDTNRDVYYLELSGEYALYIDSSWDQIDIYNKSLGQSPYNLKNKANHPTEDVTEGIELTQDSNKITLNNKDPIYDLLSLNEMSFRVIFKWFKESIKSLKPKITYSEQMLCQMLRSVSHVMSASNWQPAVVDLLQINVKESVIPLADLTSFACSEALKRIMKATLNVLKKESEQEASSNILLRSTEFCSLLRPQLIITA
ncbi:dynamin like TRAFAC class GTpase domain [Cryptosporidium sp. chipmunk genotype I]|uniref:dynamin like TRAFAC class GTpase domain n=1 Tax=Cryptosporidium sp. chipmunk genotype I TaxID=1280935 RepID=UPI00351AAD4F|nr:dynamin like TRAFAC class GTpase domain [Cryptosporidium sp. chipmunk genotype I]